MLASHTGIGGRADPGDGKDQIEAKASAPRTRDGTSRLTRKVLDRETGSRSDGEPAVVHRPCARFGMLRQSAPENNPRCSLGFFFVGGNMLSCSLCDCITDDVIRIGGRDVCGTCADRLFSQPPRKTGLKPSPMRHIFSRMLSAAGYSHSDADTGGGGQN